MSGSMSDRLDQDYAPAWTPEVGNKLIGTVEEVSSRFGDFGEYAIVTVAPDDGSESVAIHAFHHVLKGEFAKARPQRGDKIAVKYLGKPAGKKYELYRVIVDHAAGNASGPNWDAMASDAAAEADAAPEYAPRPEAAAHAAAPAAAPHPDDPFNSEPF